MIALRALVPRIAAIAALTSTLATSGGCYYAFGTSAPRGASAAPGAPRPSCTRSRALPIADTVVAIEGVLGVGFGGYGLLAIEDDGSLSAGEGKSLSALLLVTGVILLVPWGLSARRGYREVRRCRALTGLARMGF